MTKTKEAFVFGLDIGTRSIVGTVGYKNKNRFIVVAQASREHETRAMLDGQIHDIHAVGETIKEVVEILEGKIGEPLKQVSIAAAGRVLKTVTTHADMEFSEEKLITREDIFALDSSAIERAYEQFQIENKTDMKFYCVGYSVVKYYMNGYIIGNLESHKAKNIGVDLIATFLPDDVVDGLYRAVEYAGLEVANLTLEPIAAIEVAIPEMYRMLNIGLIDVGAGTSDISITKDGSIIAYGMLPVAGDSLTEVIARHCLVDFTTAEEIKKGISLTDTVEYKDIMGLPQTITKEQVLDICKEPITSMAKQAADKLLELNGGKPVSAVFVVGGGGKIQGYTESVAEYLGIPKERCAVRGGEVMDKIDFLEADVVKDSLLVTPVGICLNFYEASNNFIFVTFNDARIKLYDNNKLSIVDAAMQAEFPNDGLFPKRGQSLTFTINGKQKVIRGEAGEAAVITLNGEPADIHTPIRRNDLIVVKESTAGKPAEMEVGRLPEFSSSLSIFVNDKKIDLPKFASVNGELQSAFYSIKENDTIEMLNYYTVKQIVEFMDVILDKEMNIYVNNQIADMDTKVYENFSVIWTLEKLSIPEVEAKEENVHFPKERKGQNTLAVKKQQGKKEQNTQKSKSVHNGKANKKPAADKDTTLKKTKRIEAVVVEASETAGNTENTKSNIVSGEKTEELTSARRNAEGEMTTIHVTVNKKPLTLSGKKDYIYVDVFDHIDFDLSKPQGTSVETLLNGTSAGFTKLLSEGDVLDIFWKK